jgi:hypothetical protein
MENVPLGFMCLHYGNLKGNWQAAFTEPLILKGETHVRAGLQNRCSTTELNWLLHRKNTLKPA